MAVDPIVQAYLALGVGAVVPIWLGSRTSVKVPAIKKKRTSADADESDSEDETEVERFTSEDAYWFPVLGSGVLFGLYVIFKYLDKNLVNLLLSSYFSILGALALARLFVTISRASLGSASWSRQTKYKFRFTKNTKDVLWSLKFTDWHIGGLALGVALSGYELWMKRWEATNAIALAFGFNAISLLKLDSFKTGTVLLSGLFLYDVWWVFGSSHAFGESVMVNVAKNFEAPIKIVWPKSLSLLFSRNTQESDFTMLGLGDIVIPGIFVALSLRYDYHRALRASGFTKGAKQRLDPGAPYPKPYFTACMSAYVLGLATTMGVMHTFKAAQPALLYLSPACAGSVALVALAQGGWAEFWSWEDGCDDEVDEKEKKRDDRSVGGGQEPEAPHNHGGGGSGGPSAPAPQQDEGASPSPSPSPSPASGAPAQVQETDEDWTSGGVSERPSASEKKKRRGKGKK